MITKPKLDTKDAVVVGSPTYKDSDTFIKGGNTNVSYSSPIGSTDSGPNLSAKYKNPNVKQSVGEYGNNQYE